MIPPKDCVDGAMIYPICLCVNQSACGVPVTRNRCHAVKQANKAHHEAGQIACWQGAGMGREFCHPAFCE